MTPLARWVFLSASLLAGVAAQPDDDACVALCRAQASPETVGVCHERFRWIDGGRGTLMRSRIDSFCLTPCDTDRTTFDQSDDCRIYRRILIRDQGCLCQDTRNIVAGKKDSLLEMLINSGKNDGNGSRISEISTSRFLRFVKTFEDLLSYAEVPGGGEEENKVSTEVSNGVKEIDAGLGAATESVRGEITSTPAPVDWEMWCMAQCSNGQGGSACNCDIIP